MISAVANAFPNQFIQITTNVLTHLEASPNYVTLQVIAAVRALFGNRIIVSEFSNSNFMPTDPPPTNSKMWGMHVGKPWVSGQSLFKCFGDATWRMNGGLNPNPALGQTVPVTADEILMGSVDRLVTYGGQGLWNEIWYLDCLHLDVATIQYCHNALIKSVPSGIRPKFLTSQIPVGLVPSFAGSKIGSGTMSRSRLPVFKGLGTGHAKGAVIDPGDGSVGDKTDYLRRDATWGQFNTQISYQPQCPNPNIFTGVYRNGKWNIIIRSLLRGATMFYTTVDVFSTDPNITENERVSIHVVPGNLVRAYLSKQGYNNSELVTFIAPPAPL
jgi:hypothetical protein